MVYQFGDCALDTQRHTLRRGGQPVRLRAKAFQVLHYLLTQRDRAVSKQELCEHLWPKQFISDATLESTVRAVRQAIGDSGRAQQLIQTVYGYGYRVIAAVEVCADESPGTAGDAARSSPASGSAPPDDDRHTALLPCAPGSAGGDDSPCAPGLADETELTPHNGTAEVAPVWEQKPVAILAVECTFPAATAGEATASEPWRAANRWEQALVAQAQGFGGVVVQRSPSLLLVAFGIPQTLEQLPQRAVQAALRLRQLVAEGAGREPCPVLRSVIHWVPLLMDVEARDPTAELRAIGDTLALPVRLLGQAALGEILLSPELGPLIEGWCEVQAREVPLHTGAPGRIKVYAVVANRPQWARLELHGRRPLSPFVGRDRELALLRELLPQVEGGRGQVVGMIGEPGIGKSRLCYEFIRGSIAPPWLLLATQGTSYGQATPYRPLIDLLKSYLHLNGRDNGATIRDKVTTHLHRLDDSLTAAAPALLSLLEVPVEDPRWQALEAPQRRQRTFDALKRVLVRESQVQPVLLVVEDLQWIDAETQAFLDALVESLSSAQLLLVVTYRPEYRHDWVHKPVYTPLRLDPLPPAGTDAFLQALLGDDPSLAPLTPLLIARTEGNPFFLEESVRTLVETAVLVGERGHYRLAQALPTIELPATVQAVLAARIDRLPAEERRLLQTAAVIGTEVPLALLQIIAAGPEAALYLRLSHLHAAEFLYERRLFPEIEYAFTHALTREVAYNSLLHERRRALHARIVEALEALAGDQVGEQVERLAHHARRGELWEQAVRYCRQAGEKARNSGAYREAMTGFEQALEALGHLPEHPDTGMLGIELRRRLGGMLSLVGEQARSLALLGEAAARARQLDDRAQLGDVLSRMVSVRGIVGDFEGAMAAGREALELATTLGDPALHVDASYRLGQTYMRIGDYRRAAEVLRGNVAVLARSTPGYMRDRCIKSQAWLAEVLAMLGEFAEGRRHGEEALRLARGGGPWYGDVPIPARARLGALYLAQGELEAAIRVFEEGMALCRASDNQTVFGRIAGGLGEAYALTGRVAEGLALLEEARRNDLRTGALGGGYVTRLRQLSAVYLRAGHSDEAWQHACQALDLARQLKARGDQALELFQLGAVQAQASPPDAQQAEVRYREALALAEHLGMRPLQAHCHLGLGTLYAKTSRPEQAQAELSTAIELYRAMDMTFWLPQAEEALTRIGE